MDVSIIFVNYKTEQLTKDAIKSVYEKTQNLEFEIFVVDNNSQDGSIEAIEKEFPNINIIKNSENVGFGPANNLAMKMAKGKYVLCLNTDTLLINNAIKIMFDFMEKDENQNIGACGGNLYHKDMTPAYCCSNFYNIWNCSSIYWLTKFILKKHYAPKEYKTVKYVDMVTGADLFIRKSVLDKIGLFDENIFMYSEDTDLCKRIHDDGHKIAIVPDAKIFHLEGRNKKNFLKRTALVVSGKYYYLRKHNMYRCRFFMRLTYSVLHLLCYIFTLNKEHKNLFFIHLKG